MGYVAIKNQMRTGTVDEVDMSPHIKNIFKGMGTYGFMHPVRLFRTDSDSYKQLVNGKMKGPSQLEKNDFWTFPSFISTTVTNKPLFPKGQNDSSEKPFTVFVFEFKTNQDIKGVYLGHSPEGTEGEDEFLLAPGTATVKDTYESNIGLGYIIQRAKFVVCNLNFPK